MSRYFEHDEVIRAGGYPKIHDKLKEIIDVEADIKDKIVLDLGGCTGAFTLWAMAKGAHIGIVNDMRMDYLQRGAEYYKIHQKMYGFTGQMLGNSQKVDMTSDFTSILPRIDTLIARRIIYELRDDDVRSRFIDQMITVGVKTVYLQGLVRVKNHKEPLWNVELEAQMFIEKGYKVAYHKGDIMKLIR